MVISEVPPEAVSEPGRSGEPTHEKGYRGSRRNLQQEATKRYGKGELEYRANQAYNEVSRLSSKLQFNRELAPEQRREYQDRKNSLLRQIMEEGLMNMRLSEQVQEQRRDAGHLPRLTSTMIEEVDGLAWDWLKQHNDDYTDLMRRV